MSIIESLKKFLREYFLNPSWRCMVCKKEIFDESGFCKECKDSLPFNDGAICDHCGRKLEVASKFCSTCKGSLTYIDKARSVFNYQRPISTLIKRLKYENGRYVAQILSKNLSNVYFKHFVRADVITYVPMTEKALKKREFNQSKLLAEETSKLVGTSVVECLTKVKETQRQAKLNREQRQKNLLGAFRVKNKKAIRDKVVVVIDDVTTTGATAEAIAKKLKQSGAKEIYLLTVASVAPKDKY